MNIKCPHCLNQFNYIEIEVGNSYLSRSRDVVTIVSKHSQGYFLGDNGVNYNLKGHDIRDNSKNDLVELSNRLFGKSEYEKEFKDQFVCNYKGIDIYWYSNILDGENYTYWYGPRNPEYISGISTLSDAKNNIDYYFTNKGIQ